MLHPTQLARRARPLLLAGLAGLTVLLGAGPLTASPAAASSDYCDSLRDTVRRGGTVYYWPPECESFPILW